MKIHHTIYRITNKLNGKIYIGSHKTKDLDDEYMGSGKYLKRAIEKHGAENFSKEILHDFDTPEEMYAMEAEIVTADFIAENNTYNLKIGGFGGFDYINSTGKNSSEAHRIAGAKNLENARIKKKYLFANDLAFRQKFAESRRTCNHKSGYKQLKAMTDETKKLISEKLKIKQAGKSNSQYGSMWITDDIKTIKIKKDDIIPAGYRKGRMKFW